VATINTKANSRLWTNTITIAIRHRGKKGKGKEEEEGKDAENVIMEEKSEIFCLKIFLNLF
jgi:hypothetical protein